MQVREAAAADRPALTVLLAEMGLHYAERRDTATLQAAALALTSPSGRAGPFCLIALEAGRPRGFAALAGFFPAFDFTWGLLLKDIFVAGAARGSGTARALMTAVADFAQRHGYSRLDWTTDGGNDRAKAFYRAIGVPVADKLFYRLEGPALAGAARGDWPPRLAAGASA